MVKRTVENLLANGIDEIILIHSPGEREKFERELSGLPIKIEYVPQNEPKGTGDAIKLALEFINSDFLALNSAHEDSEESLRALIAGDTDKLKLLVSESTRPWEYAVVESIGEDIKRLVEKPARGSEPSNLRTVGLYFLPEKFKEYIKRAPEGPHSLIEAFNLYTQDLGAKAVKIEQEPASIKYAFDLIDAITQFTNKQTRDFCPRAKISDKASINGAVVVGEGTEIMENAVVHGPAYIGKNCRIGNNVVIRENTVIEDGVVLGVNTEVKRSYIGSRTHIHSGYVGDSVIGEDCRIGAGFITANRRLDRGNIKFLINGELVDSGKTYLGCVVGHDTKIGINASTMPGAIIGSNCIVGSGTEVSGAVESNTKIYTPKQIERG